VEGIRIRDRVGGFRDKGNYGLRYSIEFVEGLGIGIAFRV